MSQNCLEPWNNYARSNKHRQTPKPKYEAEHETTSNRSSSATTTHDSHVHSSRGNGGSDDYVDEKNV